MKNPLPSERVSVTEAKPHAKRRGRLNSAETEVEGLKLGRYPFASAVNIHMELRYGILSERTYIEEERKLKMLAGVFEELRATKKVDTTDPRHIGRKDIQAFLAWMKKNELDPTTQASYLKYLKNLLKTFHNHIIEDMKIEGVRFPKPTKKPIRVISDNNLDIIFQTLNTMPDWRGAVARGMLALYFATGVRPKEGRLVLLEDLDLGAEKVLIRHPKGEGSWASAEEVNFLRPDVVSFIERYLKEREAWIKENELDEAKVPELFPSIRFGKHHGFYTEQGFNAIKGKVEDLSGVKFKTKDFRSTLTTITCRNDRSRLYAMSAQLRHESPETTQRFYEGIERSVAGRQLKDAWKERPISMGHETPVIEKKYEPSGYA